MALSGEAKRETTYRRNGLWFAAMAHRISGLALVLFLPLHFLALGLAIENEAALEGFLRWSDLTVVKLAEAGLVALLVIHLLGGLRLLVVENFGWSDAQKSAATIAASIAALIGFIFLVRVL
ncbi:MAG: succinate dehydrogenase, cytochrome b subunit [Pseudomonadota bacterium]